MAFSSNPSHPSGNGFYGCDIHRLHGYKNYRDPYTGSKGREELNWKKALDVDGCHLCKKEGRTDHLQHGYVCPCGPEWKGTCSTCPPCKVCHPPIILSEEEIQKTKPMREYSLEDFNLPGIP